MATTTVKPAAPAAAAKNDFFASLTTEDNAVNLSVLGINPDGTGSYTAGDAFQHLADGIVAVDTCLYGADGQRYVELGQCVGRGHGQERSGKDEPVANTVVRVKVNHGNRASGHYLFRDFDGNDLLTYVPALTYKSFALIDTDGNVTFDSSRACFQPNGHNGDAIVVLVSYTGFTGVQLSVVS